MQRTIVEQDCLKQTLTGDEENEKKSKKEEL